MPQNYLSLWLKELLHLIDLSVVQVTTISCRYDVYIEVTISSRTRAPWIVWTAKYDINL